MRRTNKQGIVEIKGRESFESECLTGIKCSREYPLGKRWTISRRSGHKKRQDLTYRISVKVVEIETRFQVISK